MYKTVNIKKIERYLDFQTDLDLKTGLSVVNELWKLYQDALPLGENLEKTESQYGDDFVLLASHILLDLYKQHNQPSLIIQAICMLENALLKSIYNFHIKLTLVRLYFILGKRVKQTHPLFLTGSSHLFFFQVYIHAPCRFWPRWILSKFSTIR